MCKLLTASVKNKHSRTMLFPDFVPQRKMPDWHRTGHWTTKATDATSRAPCCIRELRLLHPSTDCSISCSQPHWAALGQQREVCGQPRWGVRSVKTFNNQSQLAEADRHQSGGRATTGLVLTSFMNRLLEAASKEEGGSGWAVTRPSLSSFLWVWC